MQVFLINILLAFAWAAVMGEITPSVLIIGFILGYFILLFARPLPGGTPYFGKAFRLTRYALYFLKALVIANLTVAWLVIRGPKHIRPAIFAFPLTAETDVEITTLANLITLTPGTLSMELSEDHKTLYIHVLKADNLDEERKIIKEGLERKLLKAVR